MPCEDDANESRTAEVGSSGLSTPYENYEADPLWPLIEKGITDLVTNQDLIEQTDRNYIVGYLCDVILKEAMGRRRQAKTKAMLQNLL